MIEREIPTDLALKILKDNNVIMSKTAWYRKVNGTSEFDRTELQAIKQMLDLSPEEFEEIFFE